MKTKILLLISILGLALLSACQNTVSLEPAGTYSEVTLAQTDNDILNASRSMDGFIQWANTNSSYLAKWPEIGVLSVQVAAKRDGWIRDAIAARDAYAVALKAWRAGTGTSAAVDAAQTKFNGAMAVIVAITNQITAYQTAHPHA